MVRLVLAGGDYKLSAASESPGEGGVDADGEGRGVAVRGKLIQSD